MIRRVEDIGAEITARTDSYFNRTKTIVDRYGDKRVTYALFLRRPVICAPRLMLDWLMTVAERRGTAIDVDLIYQEGDWIGAGEPIVYLTGSMVHLSDLETILLQKIGPASWPRTTPTRWPCRCRPLHSWRWKHATAPARKCRT